MTTTTQWTLTGAAEEPILGDTHAIAVAEDRPQDEPQALHVARQLDRRTETGSSRRVGRAPRVVLADADLLALPGDDERVGLHRSSVSAAGCHLW